MVATAARTAAGAGRPVLGVATTAKAVAELEGAGVRSMTIAALRVALDRDGPLTPGTVLVLDEVSQTSTRDAETVLSAVAACKGRLWVLGDARQGQPVLAGGLAHHLATLVQSGRVQGATLAVNRRQLDPDDRKALQLLRAGEAGVSQAIRTDHGWEHDCGSPTASRDGLADAAVADMEVHGAGQVAVLCVSHVDAEDLADRIRLRLTATGVIGGPVLEGPGWGGPRAFQQGDRVLFHTRCGGRSSGIVNGTAGTVVAAGTSGLTVRVDVPGGRGGAVGPAVNVDAVFVRSARPDGSPHLSHGWARTVDGAQGGTWQVAHLLGTPALDGFRGYVGQSRSRLPTHTWNTTPAPVVDHGGIPADQRQAAEHVLAALTRTPDTSLAARSDPYTLDGHVRALIAGHLSVLAGRPPDQTIRLAQARVALGRAEEAYAAVAGQLEGALAARDRLSPFGVVSGRGRAARRTLEHTVTRAEEQADATAAALSDACRVLGELERGHAQRDAFDRREGWRDIEVARLGGELAAHWAGVAVSCARAGDPLAYGTSILRDGFAHLTGRLDLLERRVPPDRAVEARQARRDLVIVADDGDRARTDLAAARYRLQKATASRWRTRPGETAAAQSEVESALGRLRTSEAAEARVRQVVEQLAENGRARHAVLEATVTERHDLTQARAVLKDALETTLTVRVQGLAADPPDHLTRAFGPVPETDTGRAAWCHHATRCEQAIDTGRLRPGDIRPDHTARRRISTADHLDPADLDPGGRDGPDVWAAISRQAEPPSPSPDSDRRPKVEADHGIDLGW